MNTRARTAIHRSLFRLALLLAPIAAGLTGSPHAQAGDAAPSPAGDKPPMPELNWTVGPTTASLGNRAEIKVPQGYRFIEAADTRKFMEMMGNLSSNTEFGLIAPDDGSWFVVFEFDESGYVKDDDRDKLDADAMLKTVTEGTEHANQERKKRGWGELHVVGWEVKPAYDPTSHNLEWAFRARSDEGFVVNYNTRVLGRKGVMEAALVIDPEKLQATLPTFHELLGGYQFKSGEQYAEYRSGDKVAAYGLAALVTGGAAAVALKTGLLQKLLKPLLVALAGLGAAVKKWTARLSGRSEAPTAPSRDYKQK